MAEAPPRPTRTKWLWIAAIVVLILLAIYLFANPSGDVPEQPAANENVSTGQPGSSAEQPSAGDQPAMPIDSGGSDESAPAR